MSHSDSSCGIFPALFIATPLSNSNNVGLRRFDISHQIIFLTISDKQYLIYFCYLVEHDIAEPSSNEGSQDSNNGRTRRPDLSTFYATLNEANPDPEHGQHRPGAVPMPSDVRNVFYALIDALNAMRDDVGITEESEDEALLTRMIDELVVDGETPPRSVQGVSDEFCDSMLFHTGSTCDLC